MKMSGKRRGGFTLIEVLLVIGLLALLGTVAVVGYTKIQAGSNIKAANLQVQDTARAVKLYYTTMNKYPETDPGLAALVNAPEDEKELQKWKSAGPFIEDGRLPVDPWNNQLKYEKVEASLGGASGPEFHVWSMGPDGQDGTEDDIRSWQEASGQ